MKAIGSATCGLSLSARAAPAPMPAAACWVGGCGGSLDGGVSTCLSFATAFGGALEFLVLYTLLLCCLCEMGDAVAHVARCSFDGSETGGAEAWLANDCFSRLVVRGAALVAGAGLCDTGSLFGAAASGTSFRTPGRGLPGAAGLACLCDWLLVVCPGSGEKMSYEGGACAAPDPRGSAGLGACDTVDIGVDVAEGISGVPVAPCRPRGTLSVVAAGGAANRAACCGLWLVAAVGSAFEGLAVWAACLPPAWAFAALALGSNMRQVIASSCAFRVDLGADASRKS